MTAPTPATQTSLADWLLARLDAEEQMATAAGHGCGYLHEHNAGWVEVELPAEHNVRPSYEMRFIRTMSPARVLADVAARRAIVALYALHKAVRHLASVYSDAPGYDERWAVS